MDNLIRYDITVNGATHTITGKYKYNISAGVYNHCAGLDHATVISQLEKLDAFEEALKTNTRAKYAIVNMPASNGISFQLSIQQEKFIFVGLTTDEIFDELSVFCDIMEIDMPEDEWLSFVIGQSLTLETNDECCICFELLDNQKWALTPCMHGFHTTCIAGWKKTSATCPICRIHL